MATAPRSLASRLADADSRQLARWTADRARTARRLASWHAARLRMQTCDALGLLGRLPPGSLRGSSLAEATSNDRFYMEQQRLHGPIFKLFWGSAELKICVVGFPRARRLLHAHRHVLMHPAARDITSLVAANYLRSMPPDLHPHYRRLFKAALPDGLVASLEPELRGIVRRELAGLAEGVPPEADPAARLFAALDRITLKVLLRLVLGVGPDEELARSLEESYRRLGPDGWLADVGPEQVAAFSAIRTAVLAIVGALRSAGTAGFGDSVLGRLVEAGPESSVDDAVIGNVIYLVERGRHDLRDLLRWIVKHLSDNAPFTAELHAALAAPGGQRLAEASVLETLRLDQAEAVNRRALETFTFEGYRFPKGSGVSILTRETHRDPETFPEPDRFRPHRFLERRYSADEYSPFGLGEHHCIAASTVVAVATWFVEELAGRFTWSVIGDGPRRYQAGRYHWEPATSFAIRLTPTP